MKPVEERVQNEQVEKDVLSTLNNHHLSFFKVINQITRAIDTNNEGHFKYYYNELVEYVEAHFSDQEGSLKNINHPKFVEHKKLHQIFSQGMNRLLVAIDQTGMDLPNLRRTRLIVEELINHIMISDQNL